jgi:hypothetical protein
MVSAMNRIFRTLDLLLGLALTFALAMTVATALPGQAMAAEAVSVAGNGQPTTERRSLPEFTAVSATGSIDVRIRQSAQQTLDVRADANLLALLETVVDGDKSLQIRWKHNSRPRTRNQPVVEIGMAQLQSLASSGSSDIRVDGFKATQLAAAVSGSGDIRLNKLQAEQLGVSIAGSGDVSASGQVIRLQVKIAGSGDVRSEGLKAEDVTISIAGSGDAAVQADKTLTVSIAGSGDVVYTGAATVKSSIVGSGNVTKR